MIHAIAARTVFNGEEFLDDHSVVFEGEKISAVCPTANLPDGIETIHLAAGILAPGFIDIQVNGGGGALLNNVPDRSGVDTITAGHRPTGTTGMMPTVISDTPQRQRSAVEGVRAAQRAGNHSVLGIHIEGPFFELSKRGVHNPGVIREPEATDIDWLCSLTDLTTILTLAPEHTKPGQIRQLTDAGILVCAGHTNASYRQIQDAIGEGLRGFTHLFNAMSPLAARAPGVVGAALDSASTWAGIIADGHHVDPAAIRIAHKAKSAGKLLLVTDAMSNVGSKDDFVQLYDERIVERGGRLINSQGSLAGSAIGMIDAVRVAATAVHLPLTECLRMASLYPAQFLRLDDRLGQLAPGYRADMVHFDDQFKVQSTWVAGQCQSESISSAPGSRETV